MLPQLDARLGGQLEHGRKVSTIASRIGHSSYGVVYLAHQDSDKEADTKIMLYTCMH